MLCRVGLASVPLRLEKHCRHDTLGTPTASTSKLGWCDGSKTSASRSSVEANVNLFRPRPRGLAFRATASRCTSLCYSRPTVRMLFLRRMPPFLEGDREANRERPSSKGG